MIQVLLVDDQSLVRDGLRAMLSLEPDLTIVGMAENGEVAIEQIALMQPDVVLMDMRMPVMNGITATQLILQQFPQVQILVLSTYDDDQYIAEAMRSGARGYLLKDMPVEELADAIRFTHRGYTQLAPGLLEKVLAPPQPANSPQEIAELTSRECEVARLVGMGATNQEISQQLFISESTVKTHIASIFNRLNLKNRSQLAIYASSVFKPQHASKT
ncbi:MAG: response regulator transcription factor [Oculatellaceae cyanobacterium Prado106]|jgi:DNA-binding NarL/FixJ family response regulator|nr:response regulator transcription factor [Oculatellaceae cyanobacterium Prado106]